MNVASHTLATFPCSSRFRFAPRMANHTSVTSVLLAGTCSVCTEPAGSYLYEPAGSVHTLHVPASNTEVTDVWFAIRGANLNLDEQGNVASVWDAGFMIETYLALCAKAGYARPPVIGI